MLQEKCAQIDQFSTQFRNVSFDENEAMISLIKKRPDDGSIDNYSEVKKVVSGLSNLRKDVPQVSKPQEQPMQYINIEQSYNQKTAAQQNAFSSSTADKQTAELGFYGTLTSTKKEPWDNVPVEGTLSSVKISKQTLKESIGHVPNEENIMEYFIDDRGYLVDGNGSLITDDSGQPILLTEENIKYLKSQNLFEE